MAPRSLSTCPNDPIAFVAWDFLGPPPPLSDQAFCLRRSLYMAVIAALGTLWQEGQ